jgi:hypothetical protein
MIAVSKFYTGVQSYLQLKSKVVIQKLAINIARKPHKLKDWNVYSFQHKIKLYYHDLSALQSLSTKESPSTKTATIYKNLHLQLVHRTVSLSCPRMGPDLWITDNQESYWYSSPQDYYINLHLKKVIRKRGEFDNSVRKYQHQENKTCYKIINYA